MEVKDCSVPYSFHILIILLHSKCRIAKAGLIYTLWTHQIFLCSYKVCELCPQVPNNLTADYHTFFCPQVPNNLTADYHTFCADVYTCLTCLLLPCISVCVCLLAGVYTYIVCLCIILFAQDILRCRVLTSGIFETKFVVEKVHFQ